MKGVCIADLHMDAIPIENLNNELKIFTDTLAESKELDLIVFCGDLFDKKIYLNNEWVDFIMRFIHSVVVIAKEKNAKIRMVYGTESHESNQYGIFDIYQMDPEVDFRVIYKVEEETIKDSCILYVPEEYLEDQTSYYKPYFKTKNKYDFVFGHGVIQDIMTMVKKPTKQNRLTHPIFTTKMLSHICKGQVFFGHYHVKSESENVCYIGSFSRWKHGEEEDKGFYTFEKTKSEKYKKSFIINTLARIYKTYVFGYDHKLFHTKSDNDLQKEITTIKNLIEKTPYDNIRILFNIPAEYENPEFLMNIIRNLIKKYSNIRCEFINGYIAKKKHIDEESVNEFISKYDYIITNKDVHIEDKLSMYIQDKYERYIDPKDISIYLTMKLEDILAENNEE